MDVTCERCGTEYEFDETLLSSRGTSVKCTNCGHVFKVFPKIQAEADPTANIWRLRLKDGSIDTIDSIRELQRRIGSGELTPTNEIARGEDGWKTLGSIPELETFFQAAGTLMPPRGISSPVPPAPESPVDSGPTSKDSSLPPGRRPRQPTLLGVMPVEKILPVRVEPGSEPGIGGVTVPESGAGTAPEPRTAPGIGPLPDSATASVAGGAPESTMASASASGAPSGAGPASYRSPYVTDSVTAALVPSAGPSADIEDAEFEERPRVGSHSSVRPSTPPPAYYDDDDDIPDLPGRGWSPLRWLLVIVAVGGLALLATQWERVVRLLGMGSDPALIAAGVAEGDASIAEGHPQAYASAIEAYGHAIEAGGDREPDILAKLSNAYALAAQAQIDDGAFVESTNSLAAAALTTAQSAEQIDPRDLDARFAVADALRLAGRYDEARSALEQTRSMSFSRTAEFYRVDARLSAVETDGSIANGLRSAKQAVELAPRGVPYLLLLSRARHAAGDDAGARVALETILADHPEHPVATKLLAELQAAEVEAAAAVRADAGIAGDAGMTAAETGAAADAGVAAAPETDAGAETAAASAVRVEKPKSGVEKPAQKRQPPAKKRRTPKQPEYDEYDQLAKAAGDDAFVDGRPPVRDYEWYMREGRAELAGGNYSRARAFFDSATEARPGSADAMDGLGQVSMRIEDFDSALRYFRAAAQRGRPDGYFNLGKAYERLGRNDEAVSAYYTYVKRRPSGTHAEAAKLAIKTLEPRVKLPAEPEPEPDTESEPSPAEEPAQGSEPAAP